MQTSILLKSLHSDRNKRAILSESKLLTPKNFLTLSNIFLQKKLRKNLLDKKNVTTFALSSRRLGYPGRIPRGQDHIATAHFKSHSV